jgi:hypothetical protein
MERNPAVDSPTLGSALASAPVAVKDNLPVEMPACTVTDIEVATASTCSSSPPSSPSPPKKKQKKPKKQKEPKKPKGRQLGKYMRRTMRAIQATRRRELTTPDPVKIEREKAEFAARLQRNHAKFQRIDHI